MRVSREKEQSAVPEVNGVVRQTMSKNMTDSIS
jgi:hypothetical protein